MEKKSEIINRLYRFAEEYTDEEMKINAKFIAETCTQAAGWIKQLDFSAGQKAKKIKQTNKLFLVSRDDCGYDEVREMAIVSSNKNMALKIAEASDWGDWRFDREQVRVTPVDMKKPQIVLVDMLEG